MRSGMMGVAPVTKADEGAKILFDFLSMIVRSSNQIGSRPCYRTALEASTSPEPPSANVFGKGYGGGGGEELKGTAPAPPSSLLDGLFYEPASAAARWRRELDRAGRLPPMLLGRGDAGAPMSWILLSTSPADPDSVPRGMGFNRK
jgi:hypothetical protein